MQSTHDFERALTRLSSRLVDQQQARIIVPPQRPSTGCWFGGGNMIEGPDGALYLVGRYRNHGDSRLGLAAGERGLELAIFRSDDLGRTFEKIQSWSKSDLDFDGKRVLSIEGSAIRWTTAGVELFVSTEKDGIAYPADFSDFLKPGAGVWSIERLAADTMDGLRSADIETVVACDDPRWLHVKDPFLHELPNGDLMLLFCSHPYCWTSSNTGCAIRRAGCERFDQPNFNPIPRGETWDVAMTRGTCVVGVPALGALADCDIKLMFYDGGECVRNLDEHPSAVRRPRGYSCEELGGAMWFNAVPPQTSTATDPSSTAWVTSDPFHDARRLSRNAPLFVSPYGTGCSRYVDVLATNRGWFVTWQQSQPDLSQPLVLNHVANEDIANILDIVK